MANQLTHSHSPYLLQHKDNPVDWYPWGEEALALAAQSQRPIFLSVGYAACHWCHVMEHESFEDPRIAALLNDRFVCIKVDREERPDIDQIYMQAVQALTGQGGWPMSVFLTPDGQPFYGGTYFPPTGRMGMPGFDQVVTAVADAWESKREQVLAQAEQMTEHLRDAMQSSDTAEGELTLDWIASACEQKSTSFDPVNGGFGSQPKFPHPMDLELLLRHWDQTREDRWLNIVTVTLSKMADGGIYDHLGGGFARYSVDAHWLVPHFEKMLYDNALLASIYLRGYQATGNDRFATVARETLEYLMRDMIDPSGGIHSTEDADSEGEEGKYYVWSQEEIIAILGEPRGQRFCQVFDVTPGGNFEGRNILNLRRPLEMAANELDVDFSSLCRELDEDKQKLLAVRESRIRPGRDDKILVSWNALAIEAFALGSQVLEQPKFLEVAEQVADFIWTQMRTDDGHLLHAYRRGVAHLDAYVDDYATLINAFITLFHSNGQPRWVERAIELADVMIQRFEDRELGGFYFTGTDHEQLILRTKDYHDSSVPSGNGEAAVALMRLAKLCGNKRHEAAAIRTLQSAQTVMTQQSMAASRLLVALDIMLRPTQQFVIAPGDNDDESRIRTAFYRKYRPHAILVCSDTDAIASVLGDLAAGKEAVGNKPTLYVCENFTCQAPLVGIDSILEVL